MILTVESKEINYVSRKMRLNQWFHQHSYGLNITFAVIVCIWIGCLFKAYNSIAIYRNTTNKLETIKNEESTIAAQEAKQFYDGAIENMQISSNLNIYNYRISVLRTLTDAIVELQKKDNKRIWIERIEFQDQSISIKGIASDTNTASTLTKILPKGNGVEEYHEEETASTDNKGYMFTITGNSKSSSTI